MDTRRSRRRSLRRRLRQRSFVVARLFSVEETMRRLFVPSLIVIVALLPVVSTAQQHANPHPTAAARPNIVFILTDDMALRDTSVMPKLQSLVASQGTTFSSYFVNDSLCCPSRSSILRGQFVHDHHTLGNQPPDGGFEKFHAAG